MVTEKLESNEALDATLDNIVASIKPQVLKALLDNDEEYMTWENRHKEAVEQGRPFAIVDYQRKMHRRKNVLVEQWAVETMKEAIRTYSLNDYLPDFARKEYSSMIGRVIITYDALDSLLNDLRGFCRQFGIDEFNRTPKIVDDALEYIKKWTEPSLVTDKKLIAITQDHGDMVYDSVKEIFSQMQEKLNARYLEMHEAEEKAKAEAEAKAKAEQEAKEKAIAEAEAKLKAEKEAKKKAKAEKKAKSEAKVKAAAKKAADTKKAATDKKPAAKKTTKTSSSKKTA